MATIATGVNTGRLDYGSFNSRPEHRSATIEDNWELRFEALKDFALNPYLGMAAGFIALCAAVAGLALAYTGSL